MEGGPTSFPLNFKTLQGLPSFLTWEGTLRAAQVSPISTEKKPTSFNTSTKEAETGGSLFIGGQPGLHSDFRDSQGYVERPSQKKGEEKEKVKERGKETQPFTAMTFAQVLLSSSTRSPTEARAGLEEVLFSFLNFTGIS